MGRPFAHELSFIGETLNEVNDIQILPLAREVVAASSGSVILIGAGGSLSAAEFGQKLFEEKGVLSIAQTPLAFIESNVALADITVFIFTAGGNNRDILTTYSEALQRGAKRIIVLCASLRSKVSSLAKKVESSFVFSFRLKSGRDGFLATNSLLAMCALLARAFGQQVCTSKQVADCLRLGKDGFTNLATTRAHFVILYSSWGKPAAVDLESKLSEAGLAATMLSDYRHFAHGRHNWIDKQKEVTAIVSFSNPTAKKLESATLRRLPKSVPVWRTHVSDNAQGALQQLISVLGFVSEAGKAAGLDPGRPGVPDYGSKIYSLGPIGFGTKRTLVEGFDFEMATARKLAAAKLSTSRQAVVLKQAHLYADALRSKRFGAIVVDFDGTILSLNQRAGPPQVSVINALNQFLESGIPIFFATGRGDSIHESLASVFPSKLWNRIYIGYYNGSFILRFDKNQQFSQRKSKRRSALARFKAAVSEDPILARRATISDKAWQLTITNNSDEPVSGLIDCLNDYLRQEFHQTLKLAASSHSIDIIPIHATKLNCVEAAHQVIAGKDRHVLAIGDCGSLAGNDFELLHTPNSLSVDKVSTRLDRCWNFLPANCSHSSGFAFYANLFEFGAKQFKFR